MADGVVEVFMIDSVIQDIMVKADTDIQCSQRVVPQEVEHQGLHTLKVDILMVQAQLMELVYTHQNEEVMNM